MSSQEAHTHISKSILKIETDFAADAAMEFLELLHCAKDIKRYNTGSGSMLVIDEAILRHAVPCIEPLPAIVVGHTSHHTQERQEDRDI